MSAPDQLRNGSLLLVLTAAIAACGSNGKVSSTGNGGSGNGGGSTTTSQASSGGVTSGGGHGGAGGATTTASAGGSGGATSTGGKSGSGGAASSATGTGGMPTIRRPFLVGASMRSAGTAPRDDWFDAVSAPAPSLDAATADLLARSWQKDALEEHASIAAFARLTMQLLSVGAPPDLVERSQRASLDEVRHARACFALAARYGAGAVGPGPLAVHDALGARSLAEIAALAAEEGCVGETLGAVLAEEQLAVATDPEAIAVLRRLAIDEARHAELAWRLVTWAVRVGGDEVERAVAEAIERAVEITLAAEVRSYDGIDLAAWHAHGRLTCVEARAVSERAIREIVRPCAALVLARRESALDAGDSAAL